jgi:hypothetical protein
MSAYLQFKMLDTTPGRISITVTVDGVVEELHLLRTNMLVAVNPDEDGNIKIYDTVEDYPSKLSYFGQANDLHCPHGRGTIFYDDSHTVHQKYVGEISQGNWNGIGVLTYKDGTVADGTFQSNEFRGKKTFPNGDVVFGQWFDDKLEYVTAVDFADGRKLTDGKRDYCNRLLTGKLYLPGKGTFTGTIKIDFFEPYNGTIHLLDGRVYTGDCCFLGDSCFSCFCIHGRGKMTLTDGSSYSGQWYRNEINGETYGKLALVGEDSGEICGQLNCSRLMQRYLRYGKFSGWVDKVTEDPRDGESEHAEGPEEAPEEHDGESEHAEDDYGLCDLAPLEEFTEEREDDSPRAYALIEEEDEPDCYQLPVTSLPPKQASYHYDPDNEGYAQAREDWGENAARKEGLERLAKKEERRLLRESSQRHSS